MTRKFNVTGSCDPQLHYMVDLTERLQKIKTLIDNGDYFTINRARQYGKTTTIAALVQYLREQYIVISLDFQRIGNSKFRDEHVFTKAFANYLKRAVGNDRNPICGLNSHIIDEIVKNAKEDEDYAFDDMFSQLSDLCDTAEKPVVMIIDEVDSATNNQVFLDFLAQLRSYYLDRKNCPTFQSVILAGVVDVKNLKLKIHQQIGDGAQICEPSSKTNSPWNIATDFLIDMSFSADGIKGMLTQYEADYHTGMDIDLMAGYICESTSGYPFLVSRLCQLLDERISGTEQFPDKASAWTKTGYLEAEKMLTHERNTLFDSLTGKLADDPELKMLLKTVLFNGLTVSFATGNQAIEMAAMYGFVKDANGSVAIANRIFESVLYNLFLSEEELNSAVYAAAVSDKYQFIKGGRLDMKLVLERFVRTFADLYEDKSEEFREEIGRKYFLLFLRPIINGTGHSYVEARTRSMRRTDLIVNYAGEEFVVEMKIWRGTKYHADGERQLSEYLDYYDLKEGYLLTFSFAKDKEIGVKEVQYGEYKLIEAVV